MRFRGSGSCLPRRNRGLPDCWKTPLRPTRLLSCCVLPSRHSTRSRAERRSHSIRSEDRSVRGLLNYGKWAALIVVLVGIGWMISRSNRAEFAKRSLDRERIPPAISDSARRIASDSEGTPPVAEVNAKRENATQKIQLPDKNWGGEVNSVDTRKLGVVTSPQFGFSSQTRSDIRLEIYRLPFDSGHYDSYVLSGDTLRIFTQLQSSLDPKVVIDPLGCLSADGSEAGCLMYLALSEESFFELRFSAVRARLLSVEDPQRLHELRGYYLRGE